MSNLRDSYAKIPGLLHEIEEEDCYVSQIRQPALNDKAFIALCLASESLGIDSERYLFRQLSDELKGKIERSVYNKRRRGSGLKMEWFRNKIAIMLEPAETDHLIDSMPLEVCRLSRAKRSRVCREQVESSPDFGYCAAQDMHYYGYKIHAVCIRRGFFKTFNISKASVHDIHYLEDIRQHLSHCRLIGDKGCLSQHYQADLFASRGIYLKTPMGVNQHKYEPFREEFRKARKRIETLFSQLCDQFMIRLSYAKAFKGFATRIVSKLTALTIIQWINIQWINFREGRNISHLKIVVA